MTLTLSHRLGTAKPSPSATAKARIDALRAAGKTIIDFAVGEPDIPTPPHIVEAGIHALKTGQTRYTAANGILPLRSAIAGKLLRENGLAYTANEIVVGTGAKQIIHDALSATLNEGDEVIVPAPYWVSYPDMVRLQGALPVTVACGESSGFKLTAQALEEAITPRTRWLILNSPNNPSGAVYSSAELRALCEVLLRHPQVWLMSDEIYEHYLYGGVPHVSVLQVEPRLRERTLLVNGLSKTYCMTGWRIGYGAGPAPLMQAIAMLVSQSTSSANGMGQAAGVVALEGPQGFVAEAAALYGRRRDRMLALLRPLAGLHCHRPDGAFYIYAGVAGLLGKTTPQGKELQSDADVMLYLLDAAQVATIDGGSYGLSPYLRLSFATSMKNIEQGCAQLADAIGKLSA